MSSLNDEQERTSSRYHWREWKGWERDVGEGLPPLFERVSP